MPLILSRELAANLSTPMFLIDAGGTLVFCNEAAELMLGRSFAEVGSITANEFGTMLVLRGLDGEPLRRRDTPPGRAFLRRKAELRSAFRRESLEDRAYLVSLNDIVDRIFANVIAAVRRVIQKALAGEHLERLANGRA